MKKNEIENASVSIFWVRKEPRDPREREDEVACLPFVQKSSQQRTTEGVIVEFKWSRGGIHGDRIIGVSVPGIGTKDISINKKTGMGENTVGSEERIRVKFSHPVLLREPIAS